MGLLDKHLIPKASSGESKVFYLKMKGDYFRYLAEVATGQKRKDIMNESQEAYKAAFEVAQKEMPVSTRVILIMLTRKTAISAKWLYICSNVIWIVIDYF